MSSSSNRQAFLIDIDGHVEDYGLMDELDLEEGTGELKTKKPRKREVRMIALLRERA